MNGDLQGKLLNLLEKHVEQMGYELVDLKVGGGKKRPKIQLFVDKPGGVTIGDCVSLSKYLNPILDVADLFPGSYIFEVSSPGLERPLKKFSDFQRFSGQFVKLVSLTHGFISGKLEKAEHNIIHVISENDKTYYIEFEDIKKANLWFKG